MSEEPKEQYGLEPDQQADAATPASPAPRAGRPLSSSASPSIEPSGAGPLPLEGGERGEIDELPPGQRRVKELDVCPNCGAAMRDVSEVVCLRCGFDLKTMKQVKTATGVVEVSKPGTFEDDDRPQRKPMVRAGMGDRLVPLIAAAAAGALLVLAHLAGVRGLFPPVLDSEGAALPNADIPLQMRFVGLLQFLALSAMWAGCGLGALTFTAYLNGLRLGELRLAAARMLAIVMITRLVTVMNFANSSVEWTIEAVVQAAAFGGLSLLLLGWGGAGELKPRDLPTFIGGTIILFMLLWVGAWTIVWATG